MIGIGLPAEQARLGPPVVELVPAHAEQVRAGADADEAAVVGHRRRDPLTGLWEEQPDGGA